MADAPGMPAALNLLLVFNNGSASEYDVRMLEVYEKRLMLAGFGNYSDGKVVSSERKGVPALGKVTQNFFTEYNAAYNSAGDSEAATQVLHEYNQHLVLAGFANHYDDDYFTTIDLGKVISLVSSLGSYGASKEPMMPGDSQEFEARHQASTIRVGYLAAANLLSELEMGLASSDDVRKLKMYEGRLKVSGFCGKTRRVRTRRSVKNIREWPPSLGIITNNFLQDLAEEVASIPDIETKTLRLDEFDERLRLAGFSDHYDAVKIQVLRNEFVNDFRIASGEALWEEIEASHSCEMPAESSYVVPVEAKPSIDLPDETSSVVPVETKASKDLPDEDSTKTSIDMPDEASHLLPVEANASIDLPDETSSVVPVEAKASKDLPDEAPSVVPVKAKSSSDLPDKASSVVPVEAKSSRDLADEASILVPVETKSSGDLRNEASIVMPVEAKSSSVLPDEASSMVPVEAKASSGMAHVASSVVPDGDIANVLGTYSCRVIDENASEADDYTNQEAHGSSKWRLVKLDSPPPPVRPHARRRSEDASKDPRVTYEAALQGVLPEQTSRHMSEEREAIDAVASFMAGKDTIKEKHEDASEMTSADILVEADEVVHPDESYDDDEDYVESKIQQPYQHLRDLPIDPEVSDEDPHEMTADNESEVSVDDASVATVKDGSEVTGASIIEEAGEVVYLDKPNDKDEDYIETQIQQLHQYLRVLPTIREVTDEDASDVSDDDASVTTVKDASEVTRADIIEKAYEVVHPDEPYGSDEGYIGAQFRRDLMDQPTDREVTYEDANKMGDKYTCAMSFKGARNFPPTTVCRNGPRESAADIEGRDPRDVPAANTSQVAYNNNTSPIRVRSNGEDSQISYEEVIQRLQPEQTLPYDDPSLSQKLHQNSSCVTVARGVAADTSMLTNADPSEVTNESSAQKLEKLNTLLPPRRPRQRHRRVRDPRVTYALKHSVPVEDRFKVVARRRLSAPVDWFSAGLDPPPESRGTYASLYSHLPLVIRAFGLSERLNEINAQLVDAASHMAILLRKQYDGAVAAFEKHLSDVQAERAAASNGANRKGRQQPNQEEWRRSIIIWLVLRRDRYPRKFRYTPLNFSCPLTIRASAIAERMKWIDTRLANGDAQQAFLLLKEFNEVVASIHWQLDAPIPGEVPPDNSPRPLPPYLDELRRTRNRARKDYSYWHSSENKQILKELTSEFKRGIAIFRASEESGQA